VSGAAGVTAFDASLILQYVAGVIKAFPAASTAAERAADVTAAREFMRRAQGSFTVALGEPRREAGEWLVPVTVAGDAPVWALEVRLEGEAASTLAGVTAADGERVLRASGAGDGVAAVALAALDPLAQGEVALLRFPVGTGDFHAPRLAFARVNETTVPASVQPETPRLSYLGRPSPNPVRDAATLRLTVSTADAGAPAHVRVLDVAGRAVRTLHDAPLAAGEHALRWDLATDEGRAAPAGLYFVRARLRSGVWTQRLIVVR